MNHYQTFIFSPADFELSAEGKVLIVNEKCVLFHRLL